VSETQTDVSEMETEIDSVIEAQWARLGAAGTWMDAAERTALVGLARDPDASEHDDDPATVAATLVAHRAPSITRGTVDDLETRGLRREHYVEIVGVVGRIVAIDTYERGIGRATRPAPAVRTGPPTREEVPAARRRAGWVPTVGAIGPPTALDSVPAEAAAQEELHGALYLAYADMVDLHAVRGLTRAQMELVAARVSHVNDCHF